MVRKLCAAAVAAATLMCIVPAARGEVLIDPSRKYASARNFAFELRFGPYRPDVDSQFSNMSTRPYQQYFGSGSSFMSQAEFDWEFFKEFGTAAVGLSAGWFRASGHGIELNGSQSADETTLAIVPLSASLIYRFDVLADRFKIPLAPYGKLGLDYDLWWTTNGNGDISTDATGAKGRGGTMGWHAALGLSLLLDVLDPAAARQFDSETGVNHTYLFFELVHYDVSGLGSSHKLVLSDNTWLAGLMFEF